MTHTLGRYREADDHAVFAGLAMIKFLQPAASCLECRALEPSRGERPESSGARWPCKVTVVAPRVLPESIHALEREKRSNARKGAKGRGVGQARRSRGETESAPSAAARDDDNVEVDVDEGDDDDEVDVDEGNDDDDDDDDNYNDDEEENENDVP